MALSIPEACQACSIGRSSLYAAIKRGDLAIRKVGRRTVITPEALQAWLGSAATSPERTLAERERRS